MAAEKIEFSLGSKFEGEGFKQATQAIKDNRQEINGARQGLGALTSAFKEVSPEAATAVGAVQKFGQAFVTGGIIGGAISLALQGLAFAVTKVTEKMQEAAEASKKYADILRNDVLAAMGESSAQFQKLSTDIDKANREIKDSLALLNGDVARGAQNKVHELHINTLQQITDDMSETGRAAILANEALNQTVIKRDAALQQATNVINAQMEIAENAAKVKNAADAAVVAAETKLAELQERSAEYLAKRQALDDAIANAEQMYNDGIIDLSKYRQLQKEGALKAAELEETYKDQIGYLKDATAKLEAARLNAANAADAESKAETQLEQAQLNIEAQRTKYEAELMDATRKRQEAVELNEIAIDEETSAEEAMIERMNELDSALSEWKDSTNELSKAEKKAKEDLEKGGDGGGGNFDPNKVQKVNVVKGTGVSVDVDFNNVNEEIGKPKDLDDKTWNRMRQGLANVADMQKVQRFQDKAQRDRETQLKRIESDSVKFLKIADTPESWRSKADENFIDIYKQKVLPQLPKEIAAKMLGDAGKHVLAKEDIEKFLGDNGTILKYLKNLGLK